MSSVQEIRTTKKRGSSLAAPSVVIQNTKPGSSSRMSFGGPASRRSNVRTSMSYSSGSHVVPEGVTARASKETIQNVMGSRGQEKKDIAILNGRLAGFIENNRFNEAVNKALTEENRKLRELKGLCGKRVKEDYEDELTEAREALALAQKELAPLQAEVMKWKDQAETLDERIKVLLKDQATDRQRIDELTGMLGDLEAETAGLRRTCENLSRERDMAKRDLADLMDDNERLRCDLETARTDLIISKQECNAAVNQADFIENASEHEIEELQELLEKLKAITPNIEKMWKAQFQTGIEDVQAVCDEKLKTMCEQNRMRYEAQLEEARAAMRPQDSTDGQLFKSENKQLKSQMSDHRRELEGLKSQNAALQREIEELRHRLEMENEECECEKDKLREELEMLRAELETVYADLNVIKDAKMSLELEIACYKKLLDSEEASMKQHLEQHAGMQSRGGNALASVISGGMQGGGGSSSSYSYSSGSGGGQGGQTSQSSSMSSSTGRVKLTKTSTHGSPCQIDEMDNVGRYVSVTNKSSKDVNLAGWRLVRTLENKRRGQQDSEYTFSDCILKPSKSVKVYSSNNKAVIEEHEELNKDITVLCASPTTCKTWASGDGSVALYNKDGQLNFTMKMEYTS